jgi:hypothetical protein
MMLAVVTAAMWSTMEAHLVAVMSVRLFVQELDLAPDVAPRALHVGVIVVGGGSQGKGRAPGSESVRVTASRRRHPN